MNYQSFLEHIYQRYSGNVKLELTRMSGLLQDMDAPQTRFGGFHVAGTNGKGSVCATLEALCLTHGLKTGLNTSPHLIDYTERFRIGGRDLPFQRILDTFLRYEKLFEKWDASFFEITTAIAFACFAEENLDVAVIEVGLGGRLDATNLFTPDISVITTIGLDHIKTLGNTLEIIAAEKAGIIKPAVPLVIGKIDSSPRQVIIDIAASLHAPTALYETDWQVNPGADSTAGICFDYSFGGISYEGLSANLMGEHQAVNLATALTAFILYARGQGFAVQEALVRQAMQRINWQGRMQVLGQNPTVIVDGAHNVHGVQALLTTLNKVYPQRRLRFLISILADKDYSEMIKLFCSKADKIYIAQNQSDRAASVTAQAKMVHQHNIEYSCHASVALALEAALAECAPEDILVAGGSLYTAGEVISAFKAHA